MILKHACMYGACMYGACIYDAANFVTNGRTDQRTNKAILGVGLSEGSIKPSALATGNTFDDRAISADIHCS